MAEEDQYDLQIPPGTPNVEVLLAEVLKLFPALKLISPKDPEDPYYLAVRGDLATLQAVREHIRQRLEQMVNDLEKKGKK